MAAIITRPSHATGAAEAPYSATINIFVTSFAGLGLPRTLCLPTAPTASIGDVVASIHPRLPEAVDLNRLLITTTTAKQLLRHDDTPICSLLQRPEDGMLSLRLSHRLCGGKGGFGSQLRAAGGRMSSRKNRNQQAQDGSNRNLDGRRLRTVEEAKRLADYLAIKPEMEKKEKEERKKRWEAVVAAAEKREEEIKSGKAGVGQGRLDAGYVESKEAAEEKTREAVLKAMREGMMDVERTGSESSAEDEEGSEDESSGSNEAESAAGPSLYGWDEDDENESEVEEPNSAEIAGSELKGKGKGRAG